MVSQGLSQVLAYLLQQGKRNWWLSLLVWIVLVSPAQAAKELRVAIKDSVNQLTVGSSSKAIIKDDAGRQVGQIEPMSAFRAQTYGGNVSLGHWQAKHFWVEPTDNGYVWIGDRWYRGRTRIVKRGNGLLAINHVPMDSYLYSVVGAEMVPSWNIEALKSQAVAARTYALHKSSQSKSNLYDLDTTTATQVYKGLDTETYSTHQAVNETSGQILTHNGQPILAVFHSSSGGHTENVEDIWSSPLPYLRGVVDYDHQAPVYEWGKSFSASEVTRHIGGVGTIKALIPEKKTPRGRVKILKVVGSRGTKRMKGADFRKAMGLRSTLFTVTPRSGSFHIYGKGYGHGVGMSQWGAQGLAQQGSGYQRILNHYYRGARLSQLDL